MTEKVTLAACPMLESPVRLQLSRRRGFNLQTHSRAVNGLPAVNCARPGRWGNPYRIGATVDLAQVRRWGWKFKNADFVCTDANDAVTRFRACLGFDEAIHNFVRMELGGRNLACYCDLPAPGDPDICHASYLLELANAGPRPTTERRSSSSGIGNGTQARSPYIDPGGMKAQYRKMSPNT